MEVAEVWGERRIFKEDQGHPRLVEATSLNIWIFQFRCNQTLFPRTVLDNSEVRLDQMFVASLVGGISNTDTLLFHYIIIYIHIIKFEGRGHCPRDDLSSRLHNPFSWEASFGQLRDWQQVAFVLAEPAWLRDFLEKRLSAVSII